MKVIKRLVNLFVELREMRDLISNQIPHFPEYVFDVDQETFKVKIVEVVDYEIKFEFTRINVDYKLYPCCLILNNRRSSLRIYSYTKLYDGVYPFYQIDYHLLGDPVMLSLSHQIIPIYGIEAECISALVKYLKE